MPAPNRLAISDVRFTPATPAEAQTGLLGFVNCIVDDQLYLDGITLRRTADRPGVPARLTLSFPARRDRRGDDHPYIRPVTTIARRDIESAIISAIGRQVCR